MFMTGMGSKDESRRDPKYYIIVPSDHIEPQMCHRWGENNFLKDVNAPLFWLFQQF